MAFVSDDGANQVLSQLSRHRHFFNHDENRPDHDSDDDDEDDSFEKWKQLEQQKYDAASSDTANSVQDSTWQLISTLSSNGSDDDDGCSCYFTPKGLVRDLICRLGHNERNGRAFLVDLCRDARVDCKVFVTTPSLWNDLVKMSKLMSITLLGDPKSDTTQRVELVSSRYWERTRKEIAAMVEEQGSVSISDLTTIYSLSRDAILNHPVESLVAVLRRTNSGVLCMDRKMLLMDESKRLVSESYYRSLRQRVLNYFAGLEEPTQIDALCQEQGWDWNQVLEWLTRQIEDQNDQTKADGACDDTAMQEKADDTESVEIFLNGEIHVDAATSGQTAMYLPTSYRNKQQQEILEFISANGYITMERAVRNYRQGFLAPQIKTLVLDAFPDVSVLRDGDVFVADSILQQVETGIQDYLSQSSPSEFLDLQEYLPFDLLQSTAIVSNLLEKVGFASPTDGVAVIGNEQAIIVSKEAIQQIEDKHLSPLLQQYAKDRANEMFQAEDETNNEQDDDAEVVSSSRRSGKSARSKRKGKNSKHNNKKNKSSKGDTALSYLLPLSAVVSAVIDTYPTFQEDVLSSDDVKAQNLKWEDDDDNGGVSILAAQFCRKAFYSEKLFEQCKRAVNAELQRLESEKNSKAKMSRKDAAAKVRSVEAAFQDTFVALCYLIQAQSKSIAFCTNNLSDIFDEVSLETLKDEFLKGPCADLTSRITQHCFFQEEAEEDTMFTFTLPTQQGETNDEAKDAKELSSGLPKYCADVNTTARCHPQSYLSSPPPREPLPILRESFSGNTGIVLSKMWILCGGECYRGGVRTIADDHEGGQSTHVRPGNMEGFVSYAEENCLTLCGLPYKKLDKKSEKNFLFSRKQQLNSLLASTNVATDPLGVLEYTVMILFQQVRNLIVSGSMLCGPILESLSRERKIPSSVAAALKLLNEMIQDNDKAVNEELVSLVKECGLVRDISKHDTTPIEIFLANY